MKPIAKLAFTLLTVAWSLAAGANGHDVVPVVSARSAVKALNSNQVADIFLGKTSRFPDGTLAVPIDYSEESPLRDRFYAQFTGKSPAQIKAHWSKVIFTGRGQPPRQVTSAVEAKRAIAENPNAIGYIEQRLVDDSVRVVASR